MRHPDHQPHVYEHFIHAMSDEAKALLFTIYVLGCLLLATSLASIFLAPERLPRTATPAPTQAEQQRQVQRFIDGSPVAIPET